MTRTTRAAALLLSLLCASASPGLAPYQAAAAMLRGAPRAIPAAGVSSGFSAGALQQARLLPPATVSLAGGPASLLPVTALPTGAAAPSISAPVEPLRLAAPDAPATAATEARLTPADPARTQPVAGAQLEAAAAPLEEREAPEERLARVYDAGRGAAVRSITGAVLGSISPASPTLARPAARARAGRRAPPRAMAAAPRYTLDGPVRPFLFAAVLGVSLVSTYFFGVEAGAAVLLIGGPCATFRALADGEATRLGFATAQERDAALGEMQRILREFGRDAAKANGDPAVKSRVDGEIVARSALQGVTRAFEEFLAEARARDLDTAAGRERFRAQVAAAVAANLKVYGFAADDDAFIRDFLEKSGLADRLLEWEAKHRFVESVLEQVRAERAAGGVRRRAEDAQAPNSQPAQQTRKLSGFAALGIVGAGALAMAQDSFLGLPLAALGLSLPFVLAAVDSAGAGIWQAQDRRDGRAAPAAEQGGPAPALPDTAMVHHLQLAGLTPREIAGLLDLLVDLSETEPAPLEDRHEESRRVIEALSRPAGRARSVLLTGEPGTGKRALVETLARDMAQGRYKGLEDTRIYELDASLMVGGDAEGLAATLRGLSRRLGGKVIFFVDGPDHLRNQSHDAHNFFKIAARAAAAGELNFIVSATPSERRRLESAGRLPFEPVELTAPGAERAAAMLESHSGDLAARYGLTAAPGLFAAAARLAARYLSGESLPGSALRALERVYAARAVPARLNRLETETRRRLERLSRRALRLQAGTDDAATAARLRNAAADDLDALFALREEAEALAAPAADELVVREGDLAEFVARESGVPAARVLQSETEKLLGLEDKLKARVIHQDEAVTAFAQAVRKARAGLKDPAKPVGSFLFLGPTGVGKTEVTKALAEVLLDSESNMIRLDMSEYMEPHSVARLIGAPPGYVGYDAGGQLTEAVRARPYSIVLLDEVEKAHSEVMNILLQALDDGRLTDGKGNTVDFSNVIFVMTSNLGSQHISRSLEAGADREAIRGEVMGAVRGHFRPEFLNRLSDIVLFNPLGREQAAPIVDIHLKKVRRWLADQDIELAPVPAAVVGAIAQAGFDPLYGGRPLARAVDRMVLTPLSELLIAEHPGEDEAARPRRRVSLGHDGERITMSVEALPAEAVAERAPQRQAAAELWKELLERPAADLGVASLEALLFGAPETALPKTPHGIFHPMAAPRGGETVSSRRADDDDPDAKDAAQDEALAGVLTAARVPAAAVEAVTRWFHKVVRCAKSTNDTRPEGHETVEMRLVKGAGYHEVLVRGLPLTRAELLLNARIFENHYSRDSSSEDQSWEWADELLTRGEYGRAELFEIKRLLSAVPGAEFGYHSDREGLTFWLRLPDGPAAASAAPSPAAPSPAPAAPAHPTASPAARFLAAAGRDAEVLAPLHRVVTGLLSASDENSAYWGFRYARAALGREGFEPLRSLLPAQEYMTPAQRALYQSPTSGLAEYYDAPHDRALETELVRQFLTSRSVTPFHYAAQLSRAPMSADASRRIRARLAGVHGRAALVQAGVIVARSLPFLVLASLVIWPLGWWVHPAGLAITWHWGFSTLAVAAHLTATLFSFPGFFSLATWLDEDFGPDMSRDVGARASGLAELAARLQASDRPALARLMGRYLRAGSVREISSDEGRQRRLDAARAAVALGLSGRAARAAARSALSRARSEGNGTSYSARANLSAPFVLWPLLDAAQRRAAVDMLLAREGSAVPADAWTTALPRFTEHARTLDEASRRDLLRRLMTRLDAVQDGAAMAAAAAFVAEMTAGPALPSAPRGEGMPPEERARLFQEVFRRQRYASTAPERPAAFFAAMRAIAPAPELLPQLVEHILNSPRAKGPALGRLLAQPELAPEARASALEQLSAAARGQVDRDDAWEALIAYAGVDAADPADRALAISSQIGALAGSNNAGMRATRYAQAGQAMAALRASLDRRSPPRGPMDQDL
ncbi:MAG: AAA family ATPase [Elusimicrobiota bacterium]|nr:AAA family ATPase [Elusimicrobiota bacterium]